MSLSHPVSISLTQCLSLTPSVSLSLTHCPSLSPSVSLSHPVSLSLSPTVPLSHPVSASLTQCLFLSLSVSLSSSVYLSPTASLTRRGHPSTVWVLRLWRRCQSWTPTWGAQVRTQGRGGPHTNTCRRARMHARTHTCTHTFMHARTCVFLACVYVLNAGDGFCFQSGCCFYLYLYYRLLPILFDPIPLIITVK